MEQIPYNESAGGYGLKIDHSFDGFTSINVYSNDKSQIAQWRAMIQKAARIYDINLDYTIAQQLGVGKFSRVFKGINKSTGQLVAIKKIDKSNLTPHEKQLLRTEIAILKTVNHPHIVQLKEVYETKQVTYMVMEYIGGGELFDYIFDKSQIQQQEIAKIIYQLLTTLDYIHKCGIIHRDIKPQNILIRFDPDNLQVIDKVKITDFGLSKMVSPNQKIQESCGTLAYVAPEVLGSNGYQKEVDIWSLGILMYLLQEPIIYNRIIGGQQICHLILKFEKRQQIWQQIERLIFYMILGRHFLRKVRLLFQDKLLGKKFLKQLLTKNPNQRPCVQQLLQNQWFTKKHWEIKQRHIYNRQKQRSPKKQDQRKQVRISSFQPKSQARQIFHQFHESELRLNNDDEDDDDVKNFQTEKQVQNQGEDKDDDIKINPFAA